MKKLKQSLIGRYPLTLALILGLGLLLVSTSLVSARSFRLRKLPDKGTKFGCGTCHVNPRGGGARNSFGEDYEALGIRSGEKYTKELGQKDSDGDGFNNNREFEAGTNPGRADSAIGGRVCCQRQGR